MSDPLAGHAYNCALRDVVPIGADPEISRRMDRCTCDAGQLSPTDEDIDWSPSASGAAPDQRALEGTPTCPDCGGAGTNRRIVGDALYDGRSAFCDSAWHAGADAIIGGQMRDTGNVHEIVETFGRDVPGEIEARVLARLHPEGFIISGTDLHQLVALARNKGTPPIEASSGAVTDEGRNCPRCNGSGEILDVAGKGVRLCPTCDGQGKVVPASQRGSEAVIDEDRLRAAGFVVESRWLDSQQVQCWTVSRNTPTGLAPKDGGQNGR